MLFNKRWTTEVFFKIFEKNGCSSELITVKTNGLSYLLYRYTYVKQLFTIFDGSLRLEDQKNYDQSLYRQKKNLKNSMKY